MHRSSFAVACLAAAVLITLPAVAIAHEQRDVGEYSFVVGMLDEPVFVGTESGLDLRVSRGEEPVEGLEETLQAEVIYQDQRRELSISPRFGDPGAYRSVFFPTAAGPYTFHIFGTIEGNEIDESFTSGPEGFDEVREASSAQFPIQFPAHGELVLDAERGADAAGQVTTALMLAGVGIVLGLASLGLALAARRRST